MTRIDLTDTTSEVMMKMCDGNVLCVSVLLDIARDFKKIDPDAFDFLLFILSLDTLELYGTRFVNLYHACGMDVVKTVAVVRAVQLGIISVVDLNDIVDNALSGRSGDNENIAKIYETVKERLPNFGKAMEAEVVKLPEQENATFTNGKDRYNSNIITVTSEKYTGDQLASRMFYLAYEACGGSAGMGLLQARNGVTEKDVWDNLTNAGDYPGGVGIFNRKTDEPRADYVFGRMMKVGCKILENGIEMRDSEPRLDYQAWSRKYKTVKDLLNATVASLNNESV